MKSIADSMQSAALRLTPARLSDHADVAFETILAMRSDSDCFTGSTDELTKPTKEPNSGEEDEA